MPRKQDKRGFSLIELMVVLGIFTLIIGVGLALVSTGRLSVDVGEAKIQAEQEARLSLDKISRELRLSRASKIRISDTISFTGAETRPGAVINFQIPIGSYAEQLDLTDDHMLKWGAERAGVPDPERWVIAYSLNPDTDQLIRTTYDRDHPADAQTQVIASNITALSFDRSDISSSLITITITGSVRTAHDPIEQSLTSHIKLRN